METVYKVAGIDVHKRMLAVVVADASQSELSFERRQFGATASELHHLSAWLAERGVRVAVMESTAQYWKPVWICLERQCQLHLAQAQSNRGPRGRKMDFRDAERSVRRLLAGELVLSYVPDAEQRCWRMLTRSRHQLIEEKVRLQNQVEALLEEAQIKLSSVISDLFGVSGRRILRALAEGEADPARLAELGHVRLRASQEQLADALCGQPHPLHRQILGLFLDRLELIERQMEKLQQSTAEALRAHQEAVTRLVEVPGLGVEAAHQVIAEIGPRAAAFPSASQLASWVGTCPGRQESAGASSSNRSPKGNRPLRRLLNQAAHAAVKKQGGHLEAVFRRLLPRLGYKQAIWAIAHRLCRLIWKILHEGIRYAEQGVTTNPRALKRRTQKLVAELRRLGYQVDLAPLAPQPSG